MMEYFFIGYIEWYGGIFLLTWSGFYSSSPRLWTSLTHDHPPGHDYDYDDAMMVFEDNYDSEVFCDILTIPYESYDMTDTR